VALVFNVLLLLACASLCAYTVVIPVDESTPQEDLQWRRMSDVAAAAAAAAVEEASPGPSRETVKAIQIAARAATAATATALRRDSIELSNGPWGSPTSGSATRGAGSRAAPGRTPHGGAGLGLRGAAHGLGGGARQGRGGGARQGRGGGLQRGRGWAERGRGIERPRSGERRKSRTSVPVGNKIALIDIKDAGHTWAQTLSMFSLNISRSAARDIYDKRVEYKRRAAASENLTAPRLRRSYFGQVSQGLWDWYQTLQRVGARHLPVSGGVLEARARRIAAELGATGFKGSPHFIQNWARRYNLRNVALWGQGGSVDTEAAAPRIAQIREQLEAYPPDRIYNMDETGLFYRCIPNRAYVQAGRRRQARGTKDMKAKARVTLVLACNATGTHKISVAMIGKAKQPLCFKPPRQACPLPYFSQPSAWMDGDVFKSWFETVFLPAVRSRTTLPVVLICDNCGAHDELESAQVTFIPLPPNCTAIYQPLDLGIIACLKRRYKRRLLDLVVGAFEITLGNRTRAGAASAAGTCSPVAPEAGAPVPLSTAGVLTGAGPADAVLADESTGAVSGAATAQVPLGAPVAATEGVAGGWLLADGWWQSAGDAANEQPLRREPVAR